MRQLLSCQDGCEGLQVDIYNTGFKSFGSLG